MYKTFLIFGLMNVVESKQVPQGTDLAILQVSSENLKFDQKCFKSKIEIQMMMDVV